MIDWANDVDLQLKMISNEGKIHIWYSWSTGSYLRIIVDHYTKWWSYPDQQKGQANMKMSKNSKFINIHVLFKKWTPATQSLRLHQSLVKFSNI